jgi:hypothetical protein
MVIGNRWIEAERWAEEITEARSPAVFEPCPHCNGRVERGWRNRRVQPVYAACSNCGCMWDGDGLTSMVCPEAARPRLLQRHETKD